MTGGTRLRPDQRDRLLALVDMLVAGGVLLRGRLILQGRVVVVADELFAGAASADKLPGTVGDMLQNLYRTMLSVQEELGGLMRVTNDRSR